MEQTLIFPSVKTYSKVVIGIGGNQAGLSVQLLGGVSVQTYNGNIANNDFKPISNEILKVGAADPSRGTIEFTPAKPYDRVLLRVGTGININGGLRVYYAYQLDRVYASSENHLALCPGCTVQNPQNAVGPNEIDFSKLIQPLSEIDGVPVSQSLQFPTIKTATKLVIGVSSDGKPIDQVIDKEVNIGTTNPNNSNGETISGGLKIDPQNPYKGTIEFMTSLPYNGVIFIMERSRYYTNELKIHYAYQENVYQPVTVPSAKVMKTVSAEKVLTLFPNPTTGQITLEGNIDFTDANIFINNTFGKEVFRSKFRSKTIDLPAALPGGVYMLTVQTKDKETYTHKIILTR
ncbi:T9SS type A sorting domain-containing protein [Chryseobacterium sp. WG14]|uniref:T9SS type A sorting domain-containing protein n=1 Tax=unclassified Chryseobacterium TaxID=2593645 RepID=UPI00211E7351|nr:MULTISPECIES: T9SS type A sorting domain-containing protein [unclassified Chryseobacterium]MCQ9636883.1 T9SS type A sorting domain-containing protein [Chryseobacterium sp. WG23]MCQ9639912.1 T9SS type A sorting domain-containing protein [Chryseobacterium sp. WG14]